MTDALMTALHVANGDFPGAGWTFAASAALLVTGRLFVTWLEER